MKEQKKPTHVRKNPTSPTKQDKDVRESWEDSFKKEFGDEKFIWTQDKYKKFIAKTLKKEKETYWDAGFSYGKFKQKKEDAKTLETQAEDLEVTHQIEMEGTVKEVLKDNNEKIIEKLDGLYAVGVEGGTYDYKTGFKDGWNDALDRAIEIVRSE